MYSRRECLPYYRRQASLASLACLKSFGCGLLSVCLQIRLFDIWQSLLPTDLGIVRCYLSDKIADLVVDGAMPNARGSGASIPRYVYLSADSERSYRRCLYQGDQAIGHGTWPEAWPLAPSYTRRYLGRSLFFRTTVIRVCPCFHPPVCTKSEMSCEHYVSRYSLVVVNPSFIHLEILWTVPYEARTATLHIPVRRGWEIECEQLCPDARIVARSNMLSS